MINLNPCDAFFLLDEKGEPGVDARGTAGYYEDTNQMAICVADIHCCDETHRSQFQFSLGKVVFSQSSFFAELWPQTTLLQAFLSRKVVQWEDPLKY